MNNPDLERYLDQADKDWKAFNRELGLNEADALAIEETCMHDFRDEHECWICGKVFN
jgi:hypothetical protein